MGPRLILIVAVVSAFVSGCESAPPPPLLLIQRLSNRRCAWYNLPYGALRAIGTTLRSPR
jgi:hypothetical protein